VVAGRRAGGVLRAARCGSLAARKAASTRGLRSSLRPKLGPLGLVLAL